MRYCLWVFVGLMLVVSTGCPDSNDPNAPDKSIKFKVRFINKCPGNTDQGDVRYEFKYMRLITSNPLFSMPATIEGFVVKDESMLENILDAADFNPQDGTVDYGDLDSTPPNDDSLLLTLDYLDADSDPDATWVASAGTIRDGATVVVRIDEYCVPTYEIQNP